jgi:hypothetical protein
MKIKAAAYTLGEHGAWNFHLQITSERGIYAKPSLKSRSLRNRTYLFLQLSQAGRGGKSKPA